MASISASSLFGESFWTRDADDKPVELVRKTAFDKAVRDLVDARTEAARLAEELANERSLRCCTHRGVNPAWKRIRSW